MKTWAKKHEVWSLSACDSRQFSWAWQRESLGTRIGAFAGGTLLDIGAGPTTDVQELCVANDVGYIPVDISEDTLAKRPPASAAPILADSAELPVPSDSMDVTHSRAATAWSKNHSASISEQLRVTRPGGLAVFTEFDWTNAGAAEGSPAAEAVTAIWGIMRAALTRRGFDPTYGGRLSNDVSQVLDEQGIEHDSETSVYSLEAGDHRLAFILNAKTIVADLQKHGLPTHELESAIATVQKTQEPLALQFPALVSKVVSIRSKPVQAA